MSELLNYTLEQLDQLESEVVLSHFTVEDAYALGSIARNMAVEKFPKKPVVINITLSSGQVLYHTVTKAGAHPDNDEWINRKKRTALRFGKSSFYMGKKLKTKSADQPKSQPLDMEPYFFVSSVEYAHHGGAVPIKLENFDGLAGVITVSGLAQEEDHWLSLSALKELKKQSA